MQFIFKMRGVTLLMLIAVLRSSTLIKGQSLLDNLSSIIIENTNLTEKLTEINTKVEEFENNTDTVNDTLALFRDYIHKRENFIKNITDLNAKINDRNLSQYNENLKTHQFLNETRWKIILNNTKKKYDAFQQIVFLRKKFENLHYLNNKTNRLIENYNNKMPSDLTKTIAANQEFLENTKEYTKHVSAINKLPDKITDFFDFTFVIRLLNETYLEDLLRNITKTATDLDKQSHVRIFRIYVQPFVYFIVFLVGFLGNAMIVTIFIYQPKFRTFQNMIILNLAMADIVSVTVNLPLYHIYETQISWNDNMLHAQFFMFSRHLFLGLSIFSTLSLALQRFSATMKLSQPTVLYILRQSTRSSCVIVISIIWILSFSFALPHGIHGFIYFKQNSRNPDFRKVTRTLAVINVIFYSIIPSIAVTLLSYLTVRHFQNRLLKIPKDMPKHHKEYQKKILSKSSKVISLIPIVFLLSFLPYNIFHTVLVYSPNSDLDDLTNALPELIFYCLMFVNTWFNPLALFMASGTFRRAILMYSPFPTTSHEDKEEKNTSKDISDYIQQRRKISCGTVNTRL